MKRLALALLVCSTFAVTGCSDNAKKIIGKWEATEEEKGVKMSVILEFTADGKVKIEIPGLTDLFKDMPGAKVTMPEITYKVEGDKLTITSKEKDGKEKVETGIIKELTDEKLVISGMEMGKKEKRDVTLTKKK